MAQAAVELDAAVLDHVEDVVFSYERGSGGFGGFSGSAVLWRNHADAQVGFDGVGHADAVADHGAVFGRLETHMEFVFGGSWVAAYFGGAQVARKVVLDAAWVERRMRRAGLDIPHGIDQAELQRISEVRCGVACGGLLLLLVGQSLVVAVFALVFLCVGGLYGGEG